MKQIVADAAMKELDDGMIVGLGSGSTAALMIKNLGEEIRLGKLNLSLSSKPFLQFKDFATILAIVVFPTPLIPVHK